MPRSSPGEPAAAAKRPVVTIRRQGGARIVTIPPALLASLGADAGTRLALDVRGGRLVAEPVVERAPAARRRHSLEELLAGAEHLPEVYASVAGALEGGPVGNEAV